MQAIRQASVPDNASQLRAFLGIVNYYNKFIPQAAARLVPLYELLEKNHAWVWTEECDEVFRDCKQLLTGEAVLDHYDSDKTLKLSCDASQYGLGAVLSHVIDREEHPILYVSRTLREKLWTNRERSIITGVWSKKIP